MAASPKPKRPAPVQRMLDALFEVETRTKGLIPLVTEAVGAYATGGIPEEPMEFSWGHVPDPEPDRAKRERVIEERAAMWATASPEHAAWSRRQDRLYYAVLDWRAAVDAARDLIPTVTQWTDRMDHPEIERWSAGLRGELSELGGVIHRIRIGDLPFLEPQTIRGLESGLERVRRRGTDLLDVGPEPVEVAPRPAPGDHGEAATRVTALEWFERNLWACHDLLAAVIRNHSLKDLPPTPEMLAELGREGAISTMITSPREEAVQRFYHEVRPMMARGLERAILEARDRAGGAAGQIVEWLQRGMDVVDQLAEAATQVRGIYDQQWDRAVTAHHEITRKLDELLPLVAAPPLAQPQAGPAPSGQPAGNGAAGTTPAPAIPASVVDQLRRLQNRFEACYNGGKRLTLLVSRRWETFSKEQRPPSWGKFHENAGSTGVGDYKCRFHEAAPGSRKEFETFAKQAYRLLASIPDRAALGRLGHWIGAITAFPETCWTFALAEAAADGACHPIVATRRVLARDPEKGWRQELPWDLAERERDLERHPHWRAAAATLSLHPEAYFLTPVDDAFLASAEAIAAVLRETPDAVGGSAPAAAPADTHAFLRDGANWRIVYEGEGGSFPHRHGIRYIAALLARPNPQQPIAALEMVRGQPELNQATHTPQDVSDPEALTQYRERLKDLDEALGPDRGCYSSDELAKFKQERDQIVEEVRASEGLGDHSRRLDASAAEKARKAVRQALDRAYAMLSDADPPMTALVAHLRASIRTEGTAYAYRPPGPQPPPWSL